MKTRIEIKEQAKNVLHAKYTASLLPYLIFNLLGAALSATLLGSLAVIPFTVGLALVYLELYREEIPTPTLETMFMSVLQKEFLTKLLGMFLVGLFTFLWSCLFVIPGIVKSYSYAMTPYLLAKYERLGATDAIDVSKKLMDGHKMDLFIVDLSFIGWILLSLLTFGILNIFYVGPYMQLTRAGCFDAYLADALESGKLDLSELRVDQPADTSEGIAQG